MAKVYLRLLPRPDYVFFLDINPKQAYSRKREYSEKEYNSFRDIYRFIAKYLKAPVLDTGLSLDICCKKIFKKIGLVKE
jgi:thymidylate kinase